MIAKIYRFDPGKDSQGHYDSYEVDITAEERMTVMDLLQYIFDNLDGSLGFFAHSACQHGICGRCGVKVNGKACLACEKVLTGEDVVIDPLGQPVVRDLVVRR